MIKFFRKIRLDLLSKGKTGKYFKYALGEILLVVIGILIALQINNWNEERKTTKLEIKILSELKNDLETNLNEIKETYDITWNRQQSTILILNYFEKALPVDDSMKRAFENIKADALFNIANTSFKFIESQGFNSLSNDTLRINITEMYERHLRNIITREAHDRKVVDEELIPLMYDRFLSSPTIDSNFSFAEETINTPKNITTLREDSVFKNAIVRLQNWLLVRLRWQKVAQTVLEQLIIDVKNEMERLSN